MILKNIYSLEHNQPIDLQVQNEQISEINDLPEDGKEIYFDNAMVFPGLINSHDHLDFNLFPRFGTAKYKNYTEWGPSIQSKYASEIDAIIQIPQKLRHNWGIIKNLIGGVTTVIHHGYKTKPTILPLKIIDQFQHLHSVRFEKYWKLRLNNPFKKSEPCVIHCGEGIDNNAYNEINDLIKYNFFNKKLIAVHGVSMDEAQAQSFAALVWCPQSNEWIFDKTADIEKLKHVLPILFGTDSTLTSTWNIWDHIRDARLTEKMTDIELFQSLTTNPADLWNLNSGSLAIGKLADLVISERKTRNAWDDFFKINPADLLMIMSNGQIVLVDETIISDLPLDLEKNLGLSPISLFDRVKYIPEYLINTINEIQKFSDIKLPCKILNHAFTY